MATPEDQLKPQEPQEMTLRQYIDAYGEKLGVPKPLRDSIFEQESGWSHYDGTGRVKTSPKGARGVGQLMPGTARNLGVDPNDPIQNAYGSLKLQKQLYDKYLEANGDPHEAALLAAAAYNAGEGAVEKYKGIPKYKETQNYVAKVAQRLKREPIVSAVTPGASANTAIIPQEQTEQTTPTVQPSGVSPAGLQPDEPRYKFAPPTGPITPETQPARPGQAFYGLQAGEMQPPADVKYEPPKPPPGAQPASEFTSKETYDVPLKPFDVERVGALATIGNAGSEAQQAYLDFVRRNAHPVNGKPVKVEDAAADDVMAQTFVRLQDYLQNNPDAKPKDQAKAIALMGLDYVKNPATKGQVLPKLLHTAMLEADWTPDEFKALPSALRSQIQQRQAQAQAVRHAQASNRQALADAKQAMISQTFQDMQTAEPETAAKELVKAQNATPNQVREYWRNRGQLSAQTLGRQTVQSIGKEQQGFKFKDYLPGYSQRIIEEEKARTVMPGDPSLAERVKARGVSPETFNAVMRPENELDDRIRALSQSSVLEKPADRQRRLEELGQLTSAAAARDAAPAKRLFGIFAGETGAKPLGDLADIGGNLFHFIDTGGGLVSGNEYVRSGVDELKAFGAYMRGRGDVPTKGSTESAVKLGAGFLGQAEKYSLLTPGKVPFWAVMGGEAALQNQDKPLKTQAWETTKGLLLGLALDKGIPTVAKTFGNLPGRIGEFARNRPVLTKMLTGGSIFGTIASTEAARAGRSVPEIIGSGVGAFAGAALLSSKEAVKESALRTGRGEGFIGERLSENWKAAVSRAAGEEPILAYDSSGRYAAVTVDPKTNQATSFRPLNEAEIAQAGKGAPRRGVEIPDSFYEAFAAQAGKPVSAIVPEERRIGGQTNAGPIRSDQKINAQAVPEGQRAGDQSASVGDVYQAGQGRLAVQPSEVAAQRQQPGGNVGGEGAQGQVPVQGEAKDVTQGLQTQGIARVPVDELSLDPKRFQYKLEKDARGSTGSLKDVKQWNDLYGGLVQVWRDPADGKTYVVNGHNRFNKAVDLGTPAINVQYIDAPDAKTARAAGAKSNIASGDGTPMDAAQYFRDSGESPEDLQAQGLPLTNSVARKGVALSKLNEHIFQAVRKGEFPEDMAVAIGSKIESPDLQNQAYKAIAKAGEKRTLSKGVVDEIIDQVGAAPRETQTEQTLFGSFDTEKSLFAERAQVAAAIKRQLTGDKSLFGTAARQSKRLEEGGTQVDVEQAKALQESASEALGVFDTLKNRAGEISGILDEGAKSVAAGKRPDQVAKESYGKIKQAVQKAIKGGVGAIDKGSVAPSQPAGAAASQRSLGESAGQGEIAPPVKAETTALPPESPTAGQAKRAREILDAYENTGELSTEQEVVHAMEKAGMLPDAVAAYRQALVEDRALGMRMDVPGETFEKQVLPKLRVLASGSPSAIKAAAEPKQTISVPQELRDTAERLDRELAAAKTDTERERIKAEIGKNDAAIGAATQAKGKPTPQSAAPTTELQAERAAVEAVHVPGGYWKEPATTLAELRARATERRGIGDWATAGRLDSQANRIESRLKGQSTTEPQKPVEPVAQKEDVTHGRQSEEVQSKAISSAESTGAKVSDAAAPTAAERPSVRPSSAAPEGTGRSDAGPDAAKEEEFGPGAMKAGEPLPEVKERKFGKRFVEDERMAAELRESIGTAKYYEPIPNRLTAKQARELVNERGIPETIKIIKDEKNSLEPRIRSTMGQIVIQRLNQAYKNLKESNPTEADFILEQATDLAEWQMDYGTRLGQGVQSFAMWARLTPEGKLLSYRRSVEQARKKLKELTGDEIPDIIKAVNKAVREVHEGTVKELADIIRNKLSKAKPDSPVWQQYKDALARQLANYVDPKESVKPPLQEFTNRLLQNVKGLIKVERQKGSKLDPYDELREVVENWDKYQEAWGEATQFIRSKYEDKPNELVEIERRITDLDSAFRTKAFDKVMEDAIKQSQINFRDLARASASERIKTKDELIQDIQNRLGIKLSKEEAAQLIDRATQQIAMKLVRTREAILKQMVAARNRTAKKILPWAGRLIEAARLGALNEQVFYEAVGDKLGLPAYNSQIAKTILDYAGRIEDAPEGMPRDKLTLELTKFIAEQKGFGWQDLPVGIYYGNILSGYNTQIVNSVDTFFNVVSEINGLAIQNPRAAARIYGGLLKGFTEGRIDALLALTQGRALSDEKWLEAPRLMDFAKFGRKGGVPISQAGRMGRITKRVAESKFGYPLNAYKYVTRLLVASDSLMYRGAKEARAAVMAYRLAKGEGLTGDALNRRAREILAAGSMKTFREQAEREGFTGAEAKARATELRDLMREPDVMADAADFAGEATYNHDPHGLLGYFSRLVSQASERFKPLKLFVPFTRIVANVTNRGLNWTPYGFKRVVVGYSGGEALPPDARNQMLIRATLGTIGLVIVGLLQAEDVIQVHGAGPSDPERKRQLQGAGWRPYSIQIGDTYVSYIYTPIGLGMSILGNATDAQRYHELEQKDVATRMAYAVARVGSTVFSQSFLSGLSRLFNVLSDDPRESVTAVKQTLSSTVQSATTPTLLKDVYKLFDNKAYKSNTLMEDLVRNTPFAALALRPQLNAFGEPVRVQRQRFLDVMTSDPAWRFVLQKGLQVPVPSRTTEIDKDRRITPEEYYELIKATGPQIKQWIVDHQAKLDAQTESEAQDDLSKAAAAIRKAYVDGMRARSKSLTIPEMKREQRKENRQERPEKRKESREIKQYLVRPPQIQYKKNVTVPAIQR